MSKYIYEENVLIFGLVCSHKFSTSVRYLYFLLFTVSYPSVMRMCYAWLLKFSFFLHLLSLFVSIIPLYPFFLFSRLFLLLRVFSFQQFRAHLVTIPMTMSSSFVKITVMLGVVFTKPFPRQSVSSSLLLIYVSALSSRQVYRPLIPAEKNL